MYRNALIIIRFVMSCDKTVLKGRELEIFYFEQLDLSLPEIF